jgi:hypothetical protein
MRERSKETPSLLFSKRDKVFEKLQPDGLAFFGMKLGGEDVVLPYG